MHLGLGLRSNIYIAGRFKIETDYYPETLEALLRSRTDDGDVVPTVAVLNPLLQICPRDRPRARDIIDHPWLAVTV
jgi:serine/threonine-protein kinase SRPK3